MKTQPLKLLLLLALPAAADPQIEICIASAYCPPPYHTCSCPPASRQIPTGEQLK